MRRPDGGKLEASAPEPTRQEEASLLLSGDYPAPDRSPALVYLASLSTGSRRTMRTSLERIARVVSGGRVGAAALAWHRLRYQHTALIRAALAERYAPATANKMLSALRGVLRECFRLGYLGAEEYHRATDLPAVKGHSLPSGRSLSRAEVSALFEACARDKKSVRGARDAAVLSVLYGCGLRRGEVVALDLCDYDEQSGQLRIRSAKGRKDRITYAVGGTAAALRDWISLRGTHSGPLFVPVNRADRTARRRLTDQAIYYILRRRAREIQSRGFAPHDLRRTFIGDLLDAGADLSSAQKLSGHSDPRTTARYDRRGERAKQRAASLLDVPYTADMEDSTKAKEGDDSGR